MRNFKLEIEYDGSRYCGWQVQPGYKKSIQATIEKALHKILQEKAKLIVSGRTDAGVHSKAQVANFITNSCISPDKLQKSLNGILPKDIVILRAREEALSFHSRFNAKSKVYRYTILNRNYPSALLRNQAYFCPYPLNIKLMREEAKVLLGKHDFKSFQASNKKIKNSVRTIKGIRVIKDKDLIQIDIEADGFLYNMVRNITGTLIDIARGRFKSGYLKKILDSGDRKLAGPKAPACGLCLVKVKY